MAKITSLFNLLKRLLNSESKNKHAQREKRRRWIFGRLKCKRLPVLVTVKERKVSDAEEEQSKHALTIATAAVAEAAVAAAQAAAEVVRLTRTNTLRDHLRNHKGSRDLAAIKIQTAYRGYLARKALRALKGLVRLQAIVRGQAVRRQAVTTLKGLQTIVRIQSQVRARRARPGSNPLLRLEKESGDKKETLLHVTSKRGWADSLRLKEDIDATFIGRQEALIKKERVQEYLLSLRETRKAQQLQESEASKVNGCLSHWLDEWVAAHEHKSRRDFVICSNIMQRNADGRMELRLSELQNYGAKIAMSPPRRSFHKPNRRLLPSHNSLDSLVVPNYMSATESAMAKLRSNSTRMRSPETYSDRGSPFKNRISLCSINSDSTTTVMSRKAPISEQRSPIMKGLLCPIKLYPSAKDFH